MIELTRLKPSHSWRLYRQVARMHADTIHHGLLPQMGLHFLASVYRAVAGTRHGFVIAAISNETVIGFVAGSTNINRMYAAVLLREGPRLLAAAGMHILQTALWKKAWGVLSYPFRHSWDQHPHERGGSELLAIAVHKDERRKGLGQKLLHAFENEIRQCPREAGYTVATNIAEVASNRFYLKMGLRPTGTMTHHQLVLQLYTKEREGR